ncbi:hypothetical protein BG005_010216 [Podila minutissima]|nr:hypothetical protein BG005_010216 [Podila minutissima]
MPVTPKAMLASSATTDSKHHIGTGHSTHTNNSGASTTGGHSTKKSASSKTNRTAALKKSQSGGGGGGASARGSTPSGVSANAGASTGAGGQRSDSEDSYTVGGGFISEMDEHDSAFDGAMEYDEEDGRSLLGEDFDAAGSDVPDEKESKKEKRKREFQERLMKLETEFDDTKQTIFSYQMARYKEEMGAIMNGFHPDFHDQVEDFADSRNAAIESARLYRDYQFECAQKAYELETELAEEEYMGEREGLREKMLAVIDGKRRALREDKESLDITSAGVIDFSLENSSRAHHTRKLRRRGQEAEPGAKNSKRSKTMQPPGAKWLAPESDALDDLSLIRKVTNGQVSTKKSGTVKKK